jgi:hypothetical protein
MVSFNGIVLFWGEGVDGAGIHRGCAFGSDPLISRGELSRLAFARLNHI